MFGLMKKDLLLSILQTVTLLPLIYLYWFAGNHPINGPMMILTGGYVFMLVMSAVLINEMHEDKCHGYAFLQILPLTAREIVMSKFLMSFLLTAFLVIFNAGMFSFFPGGLDVLAFSRIYILCCGILGLCFVGVSYIGIYGFGFTTLIKTGIPVSILMALGVPILIIELFLPRMNINPLPFPAFVLSINWGIVVVCAVAVYACLMMVAIRVKAKHDTA